VQDDVSRIKNTISLMGVIYGNKLCTIMVMMNQKTDDGLFCNERTQFRAGELIKAGLTLQPVPLYQGIIEHKDWFHERRGWTYVSLQVFPLPL
jgi:N-acetylmuramoyl-L-alanine amidase CwlA